MFLEMVTMNLPLTGINDTRTLEVIGAGVAVLLDGHFNDGLELEDFILMDHAKLTMADHTAELCSNDADFESLFKDASDGLHKTLVEHGTGIKDFATQVNAISDVMVFEYPGLIRLCVRETADGI